MPKLKVFASRQGFFDTVVAAPSRQAALEAWGAHQNLFEHGMAKVAKEAAAVEAALARPGQVLRRAVGANGAYTLEGGEVSVPEPPQPSTPNSVSSKTAKAAKPPPDRKALAAAEAELARAQTEHERAMSKLKRDRERLARDLGVLERRIAAEEREAQPHLRGLRDAVERERRTYRRAGGR